MTKQLTNAAKRKDGEKSQSFKDRTDAEKLAMLIKIKLHNRIAQHTEKLTLYTRNIKLVFLK